MDHIGVTPSFPLGQATQDSVAHILLQYGFEPGRYEGRRWSSPHRGEGTLRTQLLICALSLTEMEDTQKRVFPRPSS